MIRLVARRLLLAIPLLLLVTFTVFGLVSLAPGDPAYVLAGDNPTPERVAEIRKELHLDDSLAARYGHWVSRAVHGDLGTSLVNRNTTVGTILKNKIPTTLSIAALGIVISTVVALLLAIASARKHGGIIDRASTIVSSMAIAVPPFWLGLLLIYGFAIRFSWFPAVGYRPIRDGVGPWFKSILMPAVALGAVPGAELTLQLKAALNEVMGRDYILTADAKGLRRNQVIVKHALKNAAVPVVTVLGFRIAQILAGAASIEFIFNIRGLGWVIYESAIGRDLPVLVGIVACSTLLVIAVNTLVDISYGYFNPKVRT